MYRRELRMVKIKFNKLSRRCKNIKSMNDYDDDYDDDYDYDNDE